MDMISSANTPLPATRPRAGSVSQKVIEKTKSGEPQQRAPIDHLSGTEKAAIVVRALVSEETSLTLAELPHDMQADLAQTLGRMRLVDRATMNAVLEEYIETLEQVGLSFPDSLEGALTLLGDKLDQKATRRLREMARGGDLDEVWMKLERADDDVLLGLLEMESPTVGAVLLSKLSTDKAARLLMNIDADLAKALALGIGRTEAIAPEAVARIGATLAQQVTERPKRAFSDTPTKRVGNILNSSAPELRNNLLANLERTDETFAKKVRETIFTFKDIATRVQERDVPIIIRDIQPGDMLTLLAGKSEEDAASLEFLLANMSKRAAATFEDDAAALPRPNANAYDAACNRVAVAVRQLVENDDIALKQPEDNH